MFRSKTYSRTDRIHRSSFNPCSRGCFARSLGDDLHRVICGVFQSLFSWMFRSKRVHIVGSLFWVNVSILVLVDVSLEAVVLRSLIQVPCVSILVLVDVSLEAADSGHIVFQSLFSWMFRSKIRTICIMEIWFQSLFSWMFRSKHSPRDVHTRHRGLVSILVLVDVSLEGVCTACGCRQRLASVSILVLVDVSLEVSTLHHDNSMLMVSILVLVDVSLEVMSMA